MKKDIPKMIKWAKACLISNGYTHNQPPEHILTRAWSNVFRFSTSKGFVYLKQTPPGLSLEPFITQLLETHYHAHVPSIIAINKELNCFLMKDAGSPLRELFSENFQPQILCEGILKYTTIQCAAVKHIDSFIKFGVPDWRLSKLPALYHGLISRKELLSENGVSDEEQETLYKLIPQYTSLCEELSSYKIPETLDHCDLHDNNMLFDKSTHQLTIIDWGESVITHPFPSLTCCLNNAVSRYSLSETDKTYIELQNACLKNWLGVNTKNNLLKAFALAKKLRPIYLALAFYRLKECTDPEAFSAWPNQVGWLSRCFKEFIHG